MHLQAAQLRLRLWGRVNLLNPVSRARAREVLAGRNRSAQGFPLDFVGMANLTLEVALGQKGEG